MIIINRFLNLSFEWLWSSKISKVVICKSIPVVNAKNLGDHSWNDSININCSPIIAPRGVVMENRTRNKYFFNVETSSLIRGDFKN